MTKLLSRADGSQYSMDEKAPFTMKKTSKILEQIDVTRKALGQTEYSKLASEIPEYQNSQVWQNLVEQKKNLLQSMKDVDSI